MHSNEMPKNRLGLINYNICFESAEVAPGWLPLGHTPHPPSLPAPLTPFDNRFVCGATPTFLTSLHSSWEQGQVLMVKNMLPSCFLQLGFRVVGLLGYRGCMPTKTAGLISSNGQPPRRNASLDRLEDSRHWTRTSNRQPKSVDPQVICCRR